LAKAESGEEFARLPRSSACLNTFIHHTLHGVRVGVISEIRMVVILV
jgi:hypothetical protein